MPETLTPEPQSRWQYRGHGLLVQVYPMMLAERLGFTINEHGKMPHKGKDRTRYRAIGETAKVRQKFEELIGQKDEAGYTIINRLTARMQK